MSDHLADLRQITWSGPNPARRLIARPLSHQPAVQSKPARKAFGLSDDAFGEPSARMAVTTEFRVTISGEAQTVMRVRVSAGPAGQAHSREIGLDSPLHQGTSESLSDDCGTAIRWFHMTSGLMGRGDPDDCQAAFLSGKITLRLPAATVNEVEP